jgi:protein gp37
MYKRFKWDETIRYDTNAMLDICDINKSSRIFVGSTMELFGAWVKYEWLENIFNATKDFPHHTFIFLTKLPRKLPHKLPRNLPDNYWVGTTITNNFTYIGDMQRVEAKVKFLSIEPLLKWDNLQKQRDNLPERLSQMGINWIIIGQQTPVKASTMPKIGWIEEIVMAADKANIPVFLKDNLRPLIWRSHISPDVLLKDGKLRQELP